MKGIAIDGSYRFKFVPYNLTESINRVFLIYYGYWLVSCNGVPLPDFPDEIIKIRGMIFYTFYIPVLIDKSPQDLIAFSVITGCYLLCMS